MDWFFPKKPKEPRPIGLPAKSEASLPAVPKEKKQLSLFKFETPKEEELIGEEITIPVVFQEEKPKKEPEGFKFEESLEIPLPIERPSAPRPKLEREIEQPSIYSQEDFITRPHWQETSWRPTTAIEFADRLDQMFDLPEIYEEVLVNIERPSWKREVEEAAHRGEPAFIQLQLIAGGRGYLEELSYLLDVPDEVYDIYRDHPDSIFAYQDDVIEPLLENLGRAFDLRRPPGKMPGWFGIASDEDMNYWLTYFEEPYYPQTG